MKARIERTMGGVAGLWLALGLVFVLLLPGFFTLPPLDRDEALFAQASAQMAASGDMVDIRFRDEARYNKPVGIYWLQSTMARITGAEGDIATYRLVSLLGALVAVGFTWATARLAMPGQGAFLAAVVLGASFMVGAEARLAKTDAVQLATITTGMFVLARAWLPGGAAQRPVLGLGTALGFWVALVSAVLVKGPIGPFVMLGALAGLSLMRRDLAIVRALRPVQGFTVFLALVLPWFIAITLRSGTEFWSLSVGRDMLAKVAVGQESHSAPPGSYMLAIWATFWPGSILLAAGLPAIWRGRGAPLVQFAMIWTVPVWILFEFTATKLIHYTLPTYPALALVSAWALVAAGPGPRLLDWIAALVPVALLLVFAIIASNMALPIGGPFVLGAVGLILTVPMVVVLYRRQALCALGLALSVAALCLSTALYPSLARMSFLWPAKSIAALAHENPGCTLIVAGYKEPSLVFLTGDTAVLESGAEAAARFARSSCAVAAIEAAERPAFDASQPGLAPDDTLEGLNLGNGRSIRFAIYIKEER